nr:MAG TPA: hypothetical protein [Caudoviricetes sp.]
MFTLMFTVVKVFTATPPTIYIIPINNIGSSTA